MFWEIHKYKILIFLTNLVTNFVTWQMVRKHDSRTLQPLSDNENELSDIGVSM